MLLWGHVLGEWVCWFWDQYFIWTCMTNLSIVTICVCLAGRVQSFTIGLCSCTGATLPIQTRNFMLSLCAFRRCRRRVWQCRRRCPWCPALSSRLTTPTCSCWRPSSCRTLTRSPAYTCHYNSLPYFRFTLDSDSLGIELNNKERVISKNNTDIIS